MKDRNSKAYWNAKLKRMGLGTKLRKPPRMRPGRMDTSKTIDEAESKRLKEIYRHLHDATTELRKISSRQGLSRVVSLSLCDAHNRIVEAMQSLEAWE